MDRRQLIAALAAAAAGTLPGLARAQDYPRRAIRIVGGFGAGTSSDVVTRLASPEMQRILGQAVVVDSVVGAAGNIAAGVVAKSPPDGYTVLMATNSMLCANPHLFPSERIDPTTAFAPIAPATTIGMVVVAGPASPAPTLAGVLEAASRQPGSVTYGTPGVGTPMHLVGEMLRERGKAPLMHVPYKGGTQAATDVAAGTVSIGIVAYTPVAGLIKAGKLRPLAVCGTQRLAALPQVPAVAELVPGVTMGAWCALVAPRGTPAAVCRQIAEAMDLALAPREVVAQLAEMGNDRIAGGADALSKLIKSEYELSGDLIRRLDIRVG